MIVADFISTRPTMGDTRTYDDISSFLGKKPYRLGVLARLYPENTASYLTDTLLNVIYRDTKRPDKYNSIDVMMYEWEVETNYIKRVELAAVPSGDGSQGSEIIMAFKERYYEKNEIFKHDKTMQQFYVTTAPVRRSDQYWEVTVRLIDNGYDGSIDTSQYQIGDTTRFQSNAFPELHDNGHIKYQSSFEKHRGFLTTHRCDDSYSSLYAATEDVMLRVAEGNGKGEATEKLYKMESISKNLLDNFLFVRNQGLLFNKTNVDAKTGKPTIYENGRPIYISDGLIEQIKRYASKYVYNEISASVFQTMLGMMAEKAKQPTGNKFVFVVNERLWGQCQNMLADWLAKFKTNGTYLWSKAANDYVNVGATFSSYEWGGNTISFKVDRALSREYGDRGFGFCIDMTADKTSDRAPVEMFTLKGGDMMTHQFVGVGGVDGLSSGPVSSPVAGSKKIIWGYSSIAVFAPYRSFILEEAVA